MKTIGIIGGMSWESSQTYYRLINERVNERLGNLHSARLILYSVDFEEIERLQASGDWKKAGVILAEAANALERAGADFIVIATNTMHKVAPQIEASVSIPLLHIADATAQKLESAGISKVGLLGTRYTMVDDFYKERLRATGLEVIVPQDDDIGMINNVIFNELCRGNVLDESRRQFLRTITALQARGAQGVILGCTEIGMLISGKDTDLPVFDTTIIHAKAAADMAISFAQSSDG